MALFKWGDFSEKANRSMALSNARINLWHGSVRSGKTIASIARWLKFVAEAPDGHLLMVGKTERTLKDNILDPIESMIGTRFFKYNRGTGEAFICGRKILVRGANDESSEGKIRGLTLAGVYGDELTLWPENFFKQCLARLSVDGAKMFGTTNPDSPYHWLKADYIDREGELNLRTFHFELSDNPNLPPSYVADLKLEYTGLWYKRFIQGLWVVAEGAIYDMFDAEEHTISSWEGVPGWERPERPPFERTVVGIDYGTSNPTAFIALGLYRGRWYAFAEYRYDAKKIGRQHTDKQHSDALKDFLANGGIVPEAIYVDPSAASFKTQLKHDGFEDVKNANNDVLDGIRIIAAAITNGKLVVHESCRELIKEFATYVWNPKKQDKGVDEPLKELSQDHSLDALRYAAKKAIGRISIGPIDKPLGA